MALPIVFRYVSALPFLLAEASWIFLLSEPHDLWILFLSSQGDSLMLIIKNA